MVRPISCLNIDTQMIFGKWKGFGYPVNYSSGEIQESESYVEFRSDFTGSGNILQNTYGPASNKDFRWFPLGKSIQIIAKIQDVYSNIPVLLFNCDNEEMVFHLGCSYQLKRENL